MSRLGPVLLFLAMSLASPAWASFSDGLKAYDAGDYAGALAAWRPLAEAGETRAQISVAELYAEGLGVRRDLRAAADWYRRAARRGDAVAQLNLGDDYATGRGVTRDPIAAYLWLDLAARQGRGWAAGRRDDIARTMSADQIAEAKRRVAAWRPEH